MTTALYPGSFDPVTNGHLDIVSRASGIFEKLILGVYDAPPKNLLFTTEERVAMAKQSVLHFRNVEVVTYTGLTVHFAQKVGAQVFVRGLRQGSDFEFEFELALMNRRLAPEIDSAFLMTANEYQFLSSSLLKEAARMGGDIEGLVPEHVAKALIERLKAQS